MQGRSDISGYPPRPPGQRPAGVPPPPGGATAGRTAARRGKIIAGSRATARPERRTEVCHVRDRSRADQGQDPGDQQARAVARQLEGVTEVYSVAGRYDLVAIVRATRNEEIADIISQRMHQVPGIVDSETLISFRVYRNSEVEAGFSLGLDE